MTASLVPKQRRNKAKEFGADEKLNTRFEDTLKWAKALDKVVVQNQASPTKTEDPATAGLDFRANQLIKVAVSGLSSPLVLSPATHGK